MGTTRVMTRGKEGKRERRALPRQVYHTAVRVGGGGSIRPRSHFLLYIYIYHVIRFKLGDS